jgi:glyoxylase-like metal-dependent hydrolase (beta-lactamase superfamily II)
MNAWCIDVVDVATIPQLPLSGFLPAAGLAEAGLAGPGGDALIDVPCFTFLLTGDGGTVLVDTGPDPVRAARAGFCARGQPGRAMLDALARRGRAADDVDLIVHTHLHYDHMQNDDIFPRAVAVVQEREARWAAGPDADEFCVSIADFMSERADRLRLLDGEHQVLPGIRLLPTGGHTPGHQAVLVRTSADKAGLTCIAGDLVPLLANLRHVQPSCRDPAAVQAFLARARCESWRVIPSHDPQLRAAASRGLVTRSGEIADGQRGNGGDRD